MEEPLTVTRWIPDFEEEAGAGKTETQALVSPGTFWKKESP